MSAPLIGAAVLLTESPYTGESFTGDGDFCPICDRDMSLFGICSRTRNGFGRLLFVLDRTAGDTDIDDRKVEMPKQHQLPVALMVTSDEREGIAAHSCLSKDSASIGF